MWVGVALQTVWRKRTLNSAPSTPLPPRANSSASTLTLLGTSWAPTLRPVSFRALRSPGGGGEQGAAEEGGGRLLEYLTTYRKQASFPQGTPAPAAQKLCFSFPLCRMGRITEPWEGIETASAPGRRRAGASAAFIGRPAQPC